MRGGILEHVYMRDVQVGQVADAVLSVDLFYEEGQNGPYEPVVRDARGHEERYGAVRFVPLRGRAGFS